MAYTYESVAPWGRSFEEYVRMFNLSDADLRSRILGCADGPASFNAKMAERSHQVISCDPLYQFTGEQIRRRIDETYDNIIAQTHHNIEHFVWTTIRSVDDLGHVRRAAVECRSRRWANGRE